ncbi:MAG: aspartyl protease family protein, partial [bacterium]
MSVRFPYDEAINPPAPTVPVRVSSIQGEWSSAVPSILDTGADITVIPARLAGDLRLRPVDEIQIRGATGASARAPIYKV